MTRARREQLDRLAQVADLMRQRDLARLGQLQHQTRALADKISALSARVELGDDPALNAARLSHAQWAQAQRVLLNQTLARQTARMIELKGQTARSVGRAAALDRLRNR